MLAATHRATLAAPRPGASALSTRAPRVLAPRARSVRVLAGLGDAVGNFLNEGKKQFTIQQAGEYDAAAVGAKVDQLIKDNSVGGTAAQALPDSLPACARARSAVA